jgi:hypothetical protein
LAYGKVSCFGTENQLVYGKVSCFVKENQLVYGKVSCFVKENQLGLMDHSFGKECQFPE